MGALKPSGVFAALDRASYGEMYHRLLWTLATRQLMLDQSAVMDCLVTDALVEVWDEQAKQFHARLFVVECFCGDEGLHRRRLEGRKRGIPGWHEVDWEHVLRMREEYPPLRSPHLRVDAVNSLEDNLEAVLELMGPRR